MKLQADLRIRVLLFSILLVIAIAGTHAQEAPKPGSSQVNVLEMRTVPQGNYLITLQLRALDGKAQRLNLQVKGDTAECITSSDPRMKGLKGKFEPIGNGVFMITLRNPIHTATQFWVFQKDGSAAVKEIPDRGEKQTAVPVADDAI